jgi:hypothetical protein
MWMRSFSLPLIRTFHILLNPPSSLLRMTVSFMQQQHLAQHAKILATKLRNCHDVAEDDQCCSDEISDGAGAIA